MEPLSPNIAIQKTSSNEISDWPVDSAVYKFFCIISSTYMIPSLCYEGRVITWLKDVDAFVEEKLKNTSEVRAFIFSVFKVDPSTNRNAFEIRQNISLIYARILNQYKPQSNGYISPYFNYYELVVAVEMVYRNHIEQNAFMFTTGLELFISDKLFCAKVQGDKICIFSSIVSPISEGGHGVVQRVYNIANQQCMALKNSKKDGADMQGMFHEICNLEKMQASFSSCEGLQLAPYMTMMTPNYYGYLDKEYSLNLKFWINGPRINDQRINMCKSFMQGYKSKTALDFWHGDLKEENILIDDEGKSVIIDWAGAISFQEAWEKKKVPTFYAKHHTNPKDINLLDNILKNLKAGVSYPGQYEEFMQIAHAMELFTAGMVMFKILTSVNPFEINEKDELQGIEKGIIPSAKQILEERQYGDDVVEAITKMLSDDYRDRYNDQEAIAIWEKITVDSEDSSEQDSWEIITQARIVSL